MHKAAFDDNSYLLTYLRDAAGFDIEDTDNQKNTPLHFACDQRANYTAFWLMSFGANVNAVNRSGETPMHQLLKAPKPLDDTKTLKELIFKGADKTVQDKHGKTPLDWYREVDRIRLEETYGHRVGSQTTLNKEVESILGEQPCYIPCLHFKQPMQKQEQSSMTFYFYIIANAIGYLGLVFYVLPFVPKW